MKDEIFMKGVVKMRSKGKRLLGSVTIYLLALGLLVGFFGIVAPSTTVCAEEPAVLTITGDDLAAVISEQVVLTWTGDPRTSQTITWHMPSTAAQAFVQYMAKGDYMGDFEKAQQKEAVRTDEEDNYFSVNLSNLSPGTEYVYRIGIENAWSEPLRFTTAEDTDKFTFMYMGDVQEGYDEWGQLLNDVYLQYPEVRFVLLGGDLTNNGADPAEWTDFISATKGVADRIPLMPTMGNHDGAMYLEYFNLPLNGPAGLEKRFYSFDYDDAHFVILDSSYNTSEKVKEWLRDDLLNTNKKWKFAMFHYPAYPVFNDGKAIYGSVRENWLPILEQNGVDMIFVGHQHMYMRTHPMQNGQICDNPKDGIVQVMGNSGSKVYVNYHNNDYIAKVEVGSNYQVVNIDGDVLTLTAQKANGELIEVYTIDKSDTVEDLGEPPVFEWDNDKKAGQPVELTFTDDKSWRNAITSVCVDGTELAADKYTITAGKITIAADVFTQEKEYVIVVKATGYKDATATQSMSTAYRVIPVIDANYDYDVTTDGINVMNVKTGVTGFKYFAVNVDPVRGHSGQEVVIFTHLRSDRQHSLNATKADFDLVDIAKAGFNVLPGDLVKAYIVDDLTNAVDVNPVLLQ